MIAALLWGLRSSERARDESDPALASVTTFETQPPPPEAEPEPTQSAKDEPAPEAPRVPHPGRCAVLRVMRIACERAGFERILLNQVFQSVATCVVGLRSPVYGLR